MKGIRNYFVILFLLIYIYICIRVGDALTVILLACLIISVIMCVALDFNIEDGPK